MTLNDSGNPDRPGRTHPRPFQPTSPAAARLPVSSVCLGQARAEATRSGAPLDLLTGLPL
jgi:hypothetical protein